MIQDFQALEKSVRSKIQSLDISHYQLTRITGISRTHIYYLSTGERRVSLEVLMCLADYFRIAYRFQGPRRFEKWSRKNNPKKV